MGQSEDLYDVLHRELPRIAKVLKQFEGDAVQQKAFHELVEALRGRSAATASQELGLSPSTTGRKSKKGHTRAKKSAKKLKRQPAQAGHIRDLIREGFFKTPRAVSDVRDQLKQAKALTYTTNQLTPALTRLTRGGELAREKASGEKGTYRYANP